jgi:anti-anti-sigma factor
VKLLATSDSNGVLRLSCEGAIQQDLNNPSLDPMASLFGQAIFSRKTVMNMERCTSIDSYGISWLLICHKHFAQDGGKLVLHSVPPMIMKVLKLVQLPKIVSVADNEAEAVTLAAKE